jgi:hypothetical protein
MAGSMKVTIFWGVEQSSLVEVDQVSGMVATSIIALIMEVITFKVPVYFYMWHIPEQSQKMVHTMVTHHFLGAGIVITSTFVLLMSDTQHGIYHVVAYSCLQLVNCKRYQYMN